MGKYIYIWEYFVKLDYLSEFKRVYGKNGEWQRLLEKGSGYLDTELLQDELTKNRFATIDSWNDKNSFIEFHKKFKDDFNKLDLYCEKFTLQENKIGDFNIVK